MRGTLSGGTNLKAVGAGVTGWFESKCSDTGEGKVKSVNLVSNLKEIFGT